MAPAQIVREPNQVAQAEPVPALLAQAEPAPTRMPDRLPSIAAPLPFIALGDVVALITGIGLTIRRRLFTSGRAGGLIGLHVDRSTARKESDE